MGAMEQDMGPKMGHDPEHDPEQSQGHEVAHSSGHDAAREQLARSNGTLGSERRARLSVAELRQLIRLMNTSDIEQITIEHERGGLRLTLRKPAPVVLSPVAAPAPSTPLIDVVEDAEEIAEEATEESVVRLVEVRAPLVGVFRSSMKPEGEPLVGPDDSVRQGQVVAAIEALNVLNEVEVAAAGRVKKVLVTDGQPVEYGQPLLLIEPRATF